MSWNFKIFIQIFLFFLVTSTEAAFLKIESLITYDYDLPVVSLIDSQDKYKLILDTGSSTDLALSEKILNRFAQRTSQHKRFQDIMGKTYSVPIWKIHSMMIFNHLYQDIEISQKIDFGFHASDSSYVDEVQGHIGITLFKDKKVLFDFMNNNISFLTDVENYAEQGEWQEFKLTEYGIEFLLKINGKIFNAVIDTGSTLSFIRPEKLDKDWKVTTHKHDFLREKGIENQLIPVTYDAIWRPINQKEWPLFILSSGQNIDIIVGMDALKGKKLIIDFIQNKFKIC